MSHTPHTWPLQFDALWQLRRWPASARLLGTLALAVLMSLAPHVPHLPLWIPAAVVILTLWRLWLEIHAGALPNKWLRNGLALLGLLAVVWNFRALNGLESGTALLSVMAGMKLLESRSVRDYSIIVFIALFLLFAELLFEQNMVLLPYLLACTTLILACLLQLHGGDVAPDVGEAIKRSARLLAQALPLAVLLFVFVPRLPGQFWVMPSRGAATTGLSDEMSPGDVSDLSLSSDVAFRVEFDGAPPPTAQRYWRAVVLHDFDGRTWRRRRGEMFAPQQVITSDNTLTYRMLMEPSNQQWIPVLDVPLRTSLRASFITSDLQVISWRPIGQRISIDVQAVTSYQLGRELPPTMRRIDTDLPGELNPRARTLARELRAASSDDASYMNAVLRRFREQSFYYTLDPPALGTHAVDEFLFTTQRGFCEHFASAFTFLMRAAGVPARVVTGYQGGELNTLSNFMVIRQSDAHAWSEVWLEGRGWVRVDPTAAIAPQRVERGIESALSENEAVPGRTLRRIQWLYQLRQGWDAVNTFWQARIVNFDSNDQRSFLQWLGFSNPDWRTLGLSLLTAFAGFFLIMLVWLGRRFRPAANDPAASAFHALQKKLSRCGVTRLPHEGPVDYLNRAMQALPAWNADLQQIRDLYVALRYQPSPQAQQLTQLKRLVRQLPSRPQ